MYEFLNSWTQALQSNNHVLALIAATLFFALAVMIELYGGAYSKKVVAPGLSDFLLDRLPVVNLNFIFVEITNALIVIFALYQIARPAQLPFVLSTIALYLIVHRAFVFMTAIGPHKNFLYDYGFKPHKNRHTNFKISTIFSSQDILAYCFSCSY